MRRLADLQASLHSLAELQAVVTALRSLAAVRVQQAHTVLESLRDYTGVVEDALAEASRGLGAAVDPGEGAEGEGMVIVFGSEHGFVGTFNEHLLAAAMRECKPTDEMLVVGSRAALQAGERGLRVSWSCPVASLGSIDRTALRVAEHLSHAGARRAAQRLLLVHARSSGGTAWRITTETLLPFEARPPVVRDHERPAPLSNLAPGALVDGLVDEWLFARITRAATESFASENAARLATMEAASENIAKKLEELSRVEREARQEEVTTELLDIVTGAEAVTR